MFLLLVIDLHSYCLWSWSILLKFQPVFFSPAFCTVSIAISLSVFASSAAGWLCFPYASVLLFTVPRYQPTEIPPLPQLLPGLSGRGGKQRQGSPKETPSLWQPLLKLCGEPKIRSPNVLEWEGQCSEGDFASMLGLKEAWSFIPDINTFTWTLGVLFLVGGGGGGKNVFVRGFSSNIWRLKRRQTVYINLYIHENAHQHIHMYMYRGITYTYISTETIAHTQRQRSQCDLTGTWESSISNVNVLSVLFFGCFFFNMLDDPASFYPFINLGWW